MQTTTQLLEIHVPDSMRSMISKIKSRKGRFDKATKMWILADTQAHRAFAVQFDIPHSILTSAAERIKAVAQTSVDLLNGLRVGSFRLTEATPERIVIEKGDQA